MPRYRVGEHGEFADSPRRIPRRGWRRVLRRTFSQIGQDRLSLIAAGVAFYAFLALFPALAALVIVYGLVADPADIERQLASLSGVVPAEAHRVLVERLSSLARTTEASLGVGLALSLGFALWSANKGTKALLSALNVAYEEGTDRGFIGQNAVGLLFTLGGIVFAIVSLFLIAAVPAISNFVSLGPILDRVLLLARWPLLGVLLMCALAILYRWGTNRRPPRLGWLTPGAILATVAWILLSLLFSLYVQYFGSFNETFGSAAAVVVLLLWLQLSVFVVCVGAELNSELEMQTRLDTTAGLSRPMGRRGAYVADHVAEAGQS